MRQFSESALRLTLAVSKAAPNSAFGKICILNVVMKDEVRFTQRSFPALSETSARLSCPESPLLVRKRGNLTFKPMQSLKAAFANITAFKVARRPASKLPLVHKRFADSNGGFRSDRFSETKRHNCALFRLRWSEASRPSWPFNHFRGSRQIGRSREVDNKTELTGT